MKCDQTKTLVILSQDYENSCGFLAFHFSFGNSACSLFPFLSCRVSLKSYRKRPDTLLKRAN